MTPRQGGAVLVAAPARAEKTALHRTKCAGLMVAEGPGSQLSSGRMASRNLIAFDVDNTRMERRRKAMPEEGAVKRPDDRRSAQ